LDGKTCKFTNQKIKITQELAIEPTRMGMELTAIGMTSKIFTL